MDEEGIMALPASQMEEQPSMEQLPSIPYSDSYEVTKQALSSTRPAVYDLYEKNIAQLSAMFKEFTLEQLDAVMRLLDYIEQNRDKYPEVVKQMEDRKLVGKGVMPAEYDPALVALMKAAVQEAIMAKQPRMQPQGFSRGGIAEITEGLRRKGRGGDTILAHINPQEAALLKAIGGSGTKNPETGLPEFGFWDFIGDVLSAPFRAAGYVLDKAVDFGKSILSSPVGQVIGTVALTAALGPSGLGLSQVMAGTAAGALVGGVSGGAKGALLGALGGYFGAPGGGFDKIIGPLLPAGVSQAAAPVLYSGLKYATTGLVSGQGLEGAVLSGLTGAAGEYFFPSAMPSADDGVPAPITDKSQMAQGTPDMPVGGTAGLAPRAAGGVPTTVSQQPVGMGTAALGPGTARTFTPTMPVGGTLDDMISNAAAASVRPQRPLPPFMGGGQQVSMGGPTVPVPVNPSATVPPVPTSSGKDFGIGRLIDEPLTYAKDLYGEYLSPSRPGVTSDTPFIERYGPLAAAGLGVMALGGGFTPPPVPLPGLVERDEGGQPITGEDLIRENPEEYLINLPPTQQTNPNQPFGATSSVLGQNPNLLPAQPPVYAPPANPFMAQVPMSRVMPEMYRFMPQQYAFGGPVQTMASVNPDGTMESLQNSQPYQAFNMGGIAGLSRGKFPRRSGQIAGPGTETSDDIPAMLSDGEFVMTARAVRGMGQGSRREGAKRMYKLMHALESRAKPQRA